MDNQQQVQIWDLFIRIFHWALAALVLVAFISGDDAGWVHVYSGYSILILISLRLIWGLVGTRYARFTSFVTSPEVALQYLKRMARGDAECYQGHNPAAGWMIMALLAILLVVNGSGYLALSTKGQGVSSQHSSVHLISPAYADDDKEHGGSGGDGFFKEIHEGMAGVLLVLIVLHVCGALASSLLHRENLIKAMLDGKKIRRD